MALFQETLPILTILQEPIQQLRVLETKKNNTKIVKSDGFRINLPNFIFFNRDFYKFNRSFC